MDFASLGIKIDSSQAKTGAADLDKLTAAGGKAEKSVVGLNEAQKKTKQVSAETKDAIDKQVGALKAQSDTFGLSARGAKLHELALTGATKAQLAQADASLKHVESMTRVRDISEKAGEAIKYGSLALAAGAVAAVYSIEKLIGSVSRYQDLAEQTGGDPAGLASLRTAADVGGVSIDQLAFTANRLQVNLSKVDDESKGAGKALAAIGIEVEKFKNLRPDEQMRALGVALNQYADGGEKVAAIQAILGREGASMLSALKELGNEQQIVNTLTNEQISLADEYKDAQARTRSELIQYAEAASTQMLPALTALTGAAKDVIEDMLGVGKGASDLEKNKAIQEWAKSGAETVAFLGDAMLALVNIAKFVSADVKLSFANIQSQFALSVTPGANTGDLIDGRLREKLKQGQELLKNEQSAQKAHQDALNNLVTNGSKFRDALAKRFSEAETKRVNGSYEGYQTGGGGSKPKLAFSNTSGGSGKGGAASERLTEYERISDAIAKVNTLQTLELEGGGKLAASERFRFDEMAKIEAAYKIRKISDVERIRLTAELTAATAKFQQVEKRDATAKSNAAEYVAGQEIKEELRKADEAFLANRAAGLTVVKDYAAAIQAENEFTQFQLSLAGQSESAQRTAIELYKIELDLQKQLKAINTTFQNDAIGGDKARAKAQAGAAGARAGVTSRGQLDATKAVAGYAEGQKSARVKEIEENDKRVKEINLVAFENEKAKNAALEEEKKRHKDALAAIEAQSADTALNQTKALGDQIYGLLVQAGKEKTALAKALFLTNKAIAVAEIIVKTEEAAAQAMVSGGTFAGIPLAAIIRATGYASAGIVAGTAIASVTGGKASGGRVEPNSLYRVNERGAEGLTVGGQDFLMMGDQGGVVTPNNKLGGGDGNITIVNNTSAKIGKVVEQRMPNGDRALIVQEAVEAMVSQFSDPNSRGSRGISRYFAVQRNR